MSAQLSEVLEQGQGAPHPQRAEAILRSVVVADLCDSTALVETLGDQRAAELIRGHDKLLRQLIRQHRGQEIDKTDGFLSLFERPIQAVAFALGYQRELQAYGAEAGVSLRARIGVHVGEVMVWRNEADDIERGAKPTEVEGLAKPVAARLMGLALPGQILVSQMAYVLAHRAEGELGSTLARLQWKSHGRFRFKGVADAVTVYEIGEPGLAPFRAPAWTGKAHREIPLWRRPAMIAVECVLLAALVALPLWHYLRPTPAIAFAERDWVVLADLRNLTGDPQFDGSLEQAFRIGLEQSRHVNVVSRVRVREGLELMQRDPDTTAIDRQIGSELAVREGARALLVPTLAEVGGRLRFTAEVVDPHSQTTLLASAGDGDSIQALLASVDSVNRELRVGLGEALEVVRRDSLPLERAATANMDALRAYSLAMDANVQNRGEEALAMARQALRIDEEFASAHLLVGLILRNAGDRAGALAAYRAALNAQERLTTRSRLLVEASLAELDATPRELIERWRVLAQLYPDDYSAQVTLAYFAWVLGQDLELAEQAYRHAAGAPQNPGRGVAHYGLGGVLLAQGRIAEAHAAFQEYLATRRRFENQLYAAAHAAERDFDAAERALAAGVVSGVGGRSLTQLGFLAVLSIDRGDFADAVARIEQAEQRSASLGLRQRLMVRAWRHGLQALLDQPGNVADQLRAAAMQLAVEAGDADPLIGIDLARHRLLLAQWLASIDTEIAEQLLAAVPEAMRSKEYPELSQRYLLARSALRCRAGQLDVPIRELQQLIERGRALYSANEVLLHCLKAAGQHGAALDLARRGAQQRGAAYAEIAGDFAVGPRNLMLSNLYLLEIAELAGPQSDEGRRAIAEFRSRWPTETLPVAIRERLERLGTPASREDGSVGDPPDETVANVSA